MHGFFITRLNLDSAAVDPTCKSPATPTLAAGYALFAIERLGSLVAVLKSNTLVSPLPIVHGALEAR
jgi:hypothetical protein